MDGECSLQARIIARRNKAGSVGKVGASVRLNPILSMQKNASAALPQANPEEYFSKFPVL
jgi:hypothetical protein